MSDQGGGTSADESGEGVGGKEDVIWGGNEPGEVDDADGGAEAEREGAEDAREAEQDAREAEQDAREAEQDEREAEAGEREAGKDEGDHDNGDDRGGKEQLDEGGEKAAQGAVVGGEVGVGVGATGEVSERGLDVGQSGDDEEDRDVESDYERSGGVGGSEIGHEAQVDRNVEEGREREEGDDYAALDKAYAGRRVAELEGELKAVRRAVDEKDQMVYRSFGEFGTAINVLGDFSDVLKGALNMVGERGGVDMESEGGEVDAASAIPEGHAPKGGEGAAKAVKKSGNAAVEAAEEAAAAAKEAAAAAKEAAAAAKEAAMAAKEGAAKTEVVRSSVDELGGDIRAYREDFGGGPVKGRGRLLGGWRGGVLAVLIAMLVGFAGGVAVEQRFVIVPFHDETEGWREHVWERYGDAIADCVIEARKRGGELVCEIRVRPP